MGRLVTASSKAVCGFRLVQSFGLAQDKFLKIEPISTRLIPNGDFVFEALIYGTTLKIVGKAPAAIPPEAIG